MVRLCEPMSIGKILKSLYCDDFLHFYNKMMGNDISTLQIDISTLI